MADSRYILVDDAPLEPPPWGRASVVAVGNFDGVHRGHQAVLADTVADARSRGLAACTLTFDPHPAQALGREAPPLLTTMDRRAELVRRCGVDAVAVRTFDLAFAAWTPSQFARELLVGRLSAKRVVVGENFRFGAHREGDLARLEALGAELGFEASAHGMAGDDAGPFSSTRARDAIAVGDVAEAERVLGRPHAIAGVVGRGAQRGRTIGFPTANLEGIPEMLPADGVYAVTVDALGPDGNARALARGVMNVGLRPTVSGPLHRTVEVHLFDFEGDLYGRALRVHLAARLRAERKFAGLDELKAQIAKDAEAARVLTSARLPAADGAFG